MYGLIDPKTSFLHAGGLRASAAASPAPSDSRLVARGAELGANTLPWQPDWERRHSSEGDGWQNGLGARSFGAPLRHRRRHGRLARGVYRDAGDNRRAREKHHARDRLRKHDKGEADRDELAAVRRHDRRRAAVGASEGEEAADADPRRGAVQEQPPPRQPDRHRVDLAGEGDGCDDCGEGDAVCEEHHMHRREQRVGAHHPLLQQHLHRIAADREHQQREAHPRSLLLLLPARRLSRRRSVRREREADEAAAEQQRGGVVPHSVRLVQQQRAQRHRGEELARLDDHLHREGDPAERDVARDERGKDEGGDASERPERRARAAAAGQQEVGAGKTGADAKLVRSHNERHFRGHRVEHLLLQERVRDAGGDDPAAQHREPRAAGRSGRLRQHRGLAHAEVPLAIAGQRDLFFFRSVGKRRPRG
mmetsp:Transcript_29594/g.86440  ORF Transcript_29594/g.86440 Transcript_29594/m.86440 type:complete len:422 (+) Transcript_29594:19-1284(+)